MTDLKFFMGLLELASSAEEELGISSLTAKDKQILQLFWNNKNTDHVVDMTYEKYKRQAGNSAASRSQYFNWIKKMLALNVLEKIGTPRSHNYKFVK